MDIETLKAKLQEDGLVHIFEWTDKPNTEYPEHSHKGKVTFYVLEGSIVLNINGTHTTLKANDSVNIPVGVPHTAKVGEDGCTYLVGEEIEGDS